jgi:hypothetical protein
MAEKLNMGSIFPELTLNIAGGGPVTLPADLNTPYAVVLFYRGHW